MIYQVWRVEPAGWARAIQAERVEFPGLEQFEFFVHKSGLDWRVSEKTTGCAIPRADHRDRATCINAAARELKDQGAEKLAQIIDQVLADRKAARP